MASYKVLKDFKYSPDGMNVVTLKEGATEGVIEKDVQDMVKAKVIRFLSDKELREIADEQADQAEANQFHKNGNGKGKKNK